MIVSKNIRFGKLTEYVNHSPLEPDDKLTQVSLNYKGTHSELGDYQVEGQLSQTDRFTATFKAGPATYKLERDLATQADTITLTTTGGLPAVASPRAHTEFKQDADAVLSRAKKLLDLFSNPFTAQLDEMFLQMAVTERVKV